MGTYSTAIECILDRIFLMIYHEHVPSPNDLIYSDLTISKHHYGLIGNAWFTLAPTLSFYISTFNGLAP